MDDIKDIFHCHKSSNCVGRNFHMLNKEQVLTGYFESRFGRHYSGIAQYLVLSFLIIASLLLFLRSFRKIRIIKSRDYNLTVEYDTYCVMSLYIQHYTQFILAFSIAYCIVLLIMAAMDTQDVSQGVMQFVIVM